MLSNVMNKNNINISAKKTRPTQENEENSNSGKDNQLFDIKPTELIDKWNNEVEEEVENDDKYEEITSKSLALDSMNELNGKIDCSSFIPIAMEEKKSENKLKVTGIPKLNFDILKNNQQIKKNIEFKKNKKSKKKDKDNHLNNSK